MGDSAPMVGVGSGGGQRTLTLFPRSERGGNQLVLETRRISRVAADPPKGTTRFAPGGWSGVAYFRLHGSPRIYFSPYDQPFLWAIARRVTEFAVPTWVVSDNTGSGAAFENATRMRDLLAIPATPEHEWAGRNGNRLITSVTPSRTLIARTNVALDLSGTGVRGSPDAQRAN